ncbi:MAG: thymidine phosphorylase [Pirellula sp.]
MIISKKRDGEKLSESEIQFFVSNYAKGVIPDYQMSAMAMAIFIRGMDSQEISQLTDAMIETGNRLQRVSDRPRVDKHSTGGLGDKTSLILGPMLACCDLDVPMISGRGLGITGGTLDKLEAISGYRCDLSEAESEKQLARIGCFITGATASLVPADKKLYALRDVTGTVPSVALITASIMSKKIAETLDALVLDVKWGTGAFLGTLTKARELAASLCSNGKRARIDTSALLSDMNQPLGKMVGNACEVDESIQVMQGRGPADVWELTRELSAHVLVSVGRSKSLEHARISLQEHLDSGRVMERFEKMVKLQGGNLDAPRRLGRITEVLAQSSGWLSQIDGQRLGQAIILMGGGRMQAGQQIDASVGLEIEKKIGDKIHKGDVLLKVMCDDVAKNQAARELVQQAITVRDQPIDRLALWQEFETSA